MYKIYHSMMKKLTFCLNQVIKFNSTTYDYYKELRKISLHLCNNKIILDLERKTNNKFHFYE